MRLKLSCARAWEAVLPPMPHCSPQFTLEPEVIYFLSDGEPTDGGPTQIVESITAMNRTQRVSIHTIGVVTQRGGGAGLTFFMEPLAQQNYGSFRLIE